MDILCEWFAGCENTADGTVWHPALGNVPTCTRCAEKLSLDLVPCTFVHEDEDEDEEEDDYGNGTDRPCLLHGGSACRDPQCIRARGGSILASELRDAETQLGTY